jgi:hypothetical protein
LEIGDYSISKINGKAYLSKKNNGALYNYKEDYFSINDDTEIYNVILKEDLNKYKKSILAGLIEKKIY